MPNITLYLSRGALPQLTRLAANRRITARRGPGAGEQPSASALIDQLACGELVAIGPVGSWRQLLAALREAEAAVSAESAALLAGIRERVETEANLEADDADYTVRSSE